MDVGLLERFRELVSLACWKNDSHNGLVRPMHYDWTKKIFLFISLTLMLFSNKIHVKLSVSAMLFFPFKYHIIKFLFYFSLAQADFPLCKNVTEQL